MEDEIKVIVVNILGVDENIVNENMSIENTQAWDSLKQVNLIIALEDEFKINISDKVESLNISNCASIVFHYINCNKII